MSMSTGPDRLEAITADLSTGYPHPTSIKAANDYKESVEGKGKPAQLTPAGRLTVWVILVLIFGPPFLIGLIRLNQWLWSL
jgi:hypothetical protein